MKLLAELKYTKTHEWVKQLEENVVAVGISDHAQDALGDIVFLNLPEVGDEVTAGKSFAEVESVKAVSEVFSPVSGIVRKINEELLDAPEKINEDAYGSWFVEVEEVTDTSELFGADDYQKIVDEEA